MSRGTNQNKKIRFKYYKWDIKKSLFQDITETGSLSARGLLLGMTRTITWLLLIIWIIRFSIIG